MSGAAPPGGGPRVDGAFVPVPARHVGTVAVDQEAVLVDESSDVLVPLNPMGALVWACFDGQSSIHEICADLAEGLGVPFEQALRDVVGVTHRLLERGMLAAPDVGPVRDPSATEEADAPDEDGRLPEPPDARVDIAFPPERDFRLAVSVADRVIGVRTNDADMLQLLRGALAPAVVDDADPQPNLSLLFGGSRGAVQDLHFLYRRNELRFRALSPGRLLRAAIAYLDDFVPAPPEVVRLDAHVLVNRDRAVLAGGAFLEMLELAGRRLARLGWRMVDVARPLLDRETLEVVLAPPSVTQDAAGIAALDAAFPRGPDELPWLSGRRKVRLLLVAGGMPEHEKLASPAQRVVGQQALVTGPRRPARVADVDALARLVVRTNTSWIVGADDTDLLTTLRDEVGPAKPPR